MARFLWNWIRWILRVAGSSIAQYECPARVVGISEPARASEASRHQQRAAQDLHGGVRPHHQLVVLRERHRLADRGQQRAGLLDARAGGPQGVEAEQDVRGSREDAGGRPQWCQHARDHGHSASTCFG
jgi:hypothetical protein